MDVLQYSAFSSDPAGGNPAGVILDARGADDDEMLAVAASLGHSESAFLVPAGADQDEGGPRIRYFSPLAEVPFCGHATIAAAVALAERDGPGTVELSSSVGPIRVVTRRESSGSVTATLTSAAPHLRDFEADELDLLLGALRWRTDELDQALPPKVAWAGNNHPVVAAGSRDRLAVLDYDYEALSTLMARCQWTTVQLVWRESADVFWARNPFPPGGVVEDPATGAAAAALGGYLRGLGRVDLPAEITIHQGNDLGRPSRLTVGIPADRATGIDVTGTAVRLL